MRLAKLVRVIGGSAVYLNPASVLRVEQREGQSVEINTQDRFVHVAGDVADVVTEINRAMNESVENSATTEESWEAWEGEVITRMRTTAGGLISIEIETGLGVIIQPKDLTYYVRRAEHEDSRFNEEPGESRERMAGYQALK